MKKHKIALLLGVTFVLASCSGKADHTHNLSLVNGVDPTCVEEGTKPYYVCDGCDLLFEDKDGKKQIDAPIKIAPIGHKLTKHEGTESTCTEKGFETYYECSGCNQKFSDKDGKNPIKDIVYKDLKAHNLVNVPKQDGDCFHDAIDEHYKCLDCNKYFKDKDGKIETTLDALTHESDVKHTLTFHEGYPATDAMDGMKDYYECPNCHNKYSDKDGKNKIDDVAIKTEGWAYFAPGFTVLNIGESPEGNVITEPVQNNEGFISNQVTIKEGTLKGHSYNFKPTEDDPTNTRTCLNKGVDTKFRLTVTNNGTETISFRYFLDNYGDKGGVDINDLKPNETRNVEFSVNWTESTPGCYHGITLNNDLKSEAKLTFNGRFSTLGKVDGKEISLKPLSEAKVLNYTVGDKFSREGLVARLHGGPNWDSAFTKIYNYKTNYDDHVFTNEDVGRKEVKVMFGGDSYSYFINVNKVHVHDLVKHEKTEPTNNLDGHEEYFECKECHKIFKDAEGKEETVLSNIKIPTVGYAHFAPGLNVCHVGADVSDTDNISSEGTKLENGLYANRITIKSGSKSNDQFWMKPSEDTPFNSRTILYNGVDTEFKLNVKNEGTEEISFRYFLDDWGDKAGVEIDNLKPGESREVTFGTPSWPSNTPGCYHGIALKSDLKTDAKILIDGYYSLHGKVDGQDMGIVPASEPSKIVYQVGDAFSNDGLRARLTNVVNKGTSFIDNLATNFDNHVFTEDDLGTQTVKVMFGGASYTYEINVYPKHEHNLVKREAVGATDNKNGLKEHYECDVCHLLYNDKDGKEPVLKEDLSIQSEGFVAFVPGFNVCKVDGVPSDTDEIDSKLVTRENGVKANNITLKKEATKGSSFWMQPNKDGDVANTRTNLLSGKDTKFKMTFTNNGEESISFRYFFDNYGDKGGVDVEKLLPKETREVEFILNFDTDTPGCYHGLTLRSDLTKDASLTINGTYSTLGRVNGKELSIAKVKDADKLIFKVGEKFNADGLIATLKGYPNEDYPFSSIVENYYTNFDNYEFTKDDLGEQIVVVSFAGSSFTYNIEVVE